MTSARFNMTLKLDGVAGAGVVAALAAGAADGADAAVVSVAM